MHHLNNIRFLFNDSSFMVLTYPEVEFHKNKPQSNPKLFIYDNKIGSKDLFDNLFQSIIWVSYRRGFSPLYTNPIQKVESEQVV